MFPSSVFESVFNSSPTIQCLLAPTTEANILAVNDFFLKTLCREREELLGVGLFTAFPENPDDLQDTGVAALRNSLARVIATGTPDVLPIQRYPFVTTLPNGEKRYEERFWSVDNTPIFDESGQLVCISHRSTDVTEKAHADKALQRSQERYRNLTESIDQGFCLIEMLFDQSGEPIDYRFCEINSKFEAQTGLQNASGKRMRELAPDHEKHWFDIYGKVAKTGEPVHFENEAKALNRWFDVYAFRIDKPEDSMVAVLFKDITERKRSHEKLQVSEQVARRAATLAHAERKRLDAVLEAVPVGIVVNDANGALVLTNSANRHLWGNEHPIAKGIDDFAVWKAWWADGSSRHGQRVQPEEWATSRILRGEEALNDVIEIEPFYDSSVRRICLNSGAPIKDDEGRIVGAVVAQMDITDRVKAIEELEQTNHRKDEFLAMLAHELRNPLAPISAAADLLKLMRLDESRIKQTSEVISRQVKHLTGLVEDLLDVSRVTRGIVKLERAELDVKKIVSDAVEQVRPLIESRQHRLTVHTTPEPAQVLGDQKRLVQVLTNLLNNAAKYTPEGGEIVLDVEIDGAHVRTSVSDNGFGMEPQLVRHAFDLFAQAERTSDRSQGGLGIGLAIVKSLVEMHSGSITAYSDGLGKGSKFTVCLPQVQRPFSVAGDELEADPSPFSTDTLKVMVVDDNKDAADMLAMLVQALGHQVTVEHSSKKALERAKAEPPFVFLLDIGMPEMDGIELARHLRTQPETAGATLIAVTGYGQEHDQNNAANAGFHHHFVKPVDSKKLAALLNEISKSLSR